MSKVVFLYGIDIRHCAWCGEPYVALSTGKRPVITCSESCRHDNWRYVRAEGERDRRKRWSALGSEAGRSQTEGVNDG